MKLLDLFAGIGGFSLAAHWMGWETAAFVEREPFCQKVLRKNFGENIEIHDDIFDFSGEPFRGRIDIITGGFPCQPYSHAGKRKGKADDRHLWPEMLRTIREVQPRFVVGENVLGLVNWSGGLVFEEVQTDLEAQGYEVLPFVLPACAKNAPHRRDRVWFVANANGNGFDRGDREHEINAGERGLNALNDVSPIRNAAIAGRDELQRSQNDRGSDRRGQEAVKQPSRFFRPAWEEFPTQPAICRGNDGIPNRVDRIKALGNSIVPQLAFEIFKAIELQIKRGELLR